MTNPEKIVYVVHNVDTEGPLSESLEATFERLNLVFNVKLEPTNENLIKLQKGEFNFGDNTAAIKKMLCKKNLNYNDTWDKINNTLAKISSEEFRKEVPDSFGKEWVYNWFCVDHTGYKKNPRKRELGDHKIYDFYNKFISKPQNKNDRIYFHYHPLPYNKLAHSCATFYFNNNHLHEILAKKIIDRQWFPTVYRAGFHTIRPDSNWFLEQWIPFDYSNQASDEFDDQPDLSNGRFGDWRRAPKIWGAYHPHPDDYQIPGSSRRLIFRCLNMDARLRSLSLRDVNDAFEAAHINGSSVLSFTNHDFRDMKSEIINTRKMISQISNKWKNVKFKYCNSLEAAQLHLGLKGSKIGLKLELLKIKHNESLLKIRTDLPIFGAQPFLAIKDKTGSYFYDNCDFTLNKNEWTYTFDWQTFKLDDVSKIGVAATNKNGNCEVLVFDNLTGSLNKNVLKI